MLDALNESCEGRKPLPALASWRGRCRCGGCGGRVIFCLLSLEPGGKILLALDLDDDRHEAMIAPAQLRALAAIDADLRAGNLEPGLVDKAGDRILLDGQHRQP